MSIASFRISGEFITQHARNLISEVGALEAERFLGSSVNGLEHKDLVAILKGDKKFIGSSETELELVDDDDTDIKEEIDRIYAGIVHYKGEYWRPYALVTEWGEHDVYAMTKQRHKLYSFESAAVPTTLNATMFLKWSQARNVAYMDDQVHDMQHNLKINNCTKVTLWGRVQGPPYWIDVKSNDWQSGLDDYLKVHKSLPARTHSEWFDVPRKPRGNRIINAPIKLEESLLESKRESKIELSYANSSSELLSTPKYDNGYITNNGEFYCCEYFQHRQLAIELLSKKVGEYLNDPEVEADNRGWIRVQKSALAIGEYNCSCCKQPTKSQLETFENWAATRGNPELNRLFVQ